MNGFSLVVSATPRPIVHLLDHLVGDPANRLLGDRRPVDLGEVRRDLPGRQTLGVQREHHLIDPGQPPLALLDDLGFKRRGLVPRHVDLNGACGLGQHRLGPGAVADVARPRTGRVVLFIAQVLGQLLIERGLEHRLSQLFEQPIGPSQGQALFLRQTEPARPQPAAQPTAQPASSSSRHPVSSSRHLPRQASLSVSGRKHR